jgi:hypothetical protein
VNNRPSCSRRLALLSAVVLSLVGACSSSPAQVDRTDAAPTGTVGAVCDKTTPGPASAPAGAVEVDPAVQGDLPAKTKANPAGTTFWLRSGTHRLSGDRFDQVMPKDGNTYLGAPGAILDGNRLNQYAFGGEAADVTIKFLTVSGFVAPHDEGVVNHDSGDGWVIESSTIQNNDGAGMMAGARQQVKGNCLRTNGQYGMNAFKSGNSITGLVVEGNEVVGNNTGDWEKRTPGCGCTGGIKFWSINGADVRGNWVHDNRGPGLWGDTNNNDFLIEGNVIENNDSAAILYETSYNAVIRQNMVRGNNKVEGKDFADRGDNFPSATIYLSESGGEPRIPARTDKIEIANNTLENNWSGITLWENADRFCNSPANTSTDSCTRLVNDPAQCAQPAITSKPLYDDCRWKTQRVDIHDNKFAIDMNAVGCRVACGRMAVLSNFGTYPDWSPYKGDVIEQAITFDQGNRWHNNTYAGPWTFVAHDTSKVLETTLWRGAPYNQDKASVFGRGTG